MSDVKVGDVVSWADVPSGAMVLAKVGKRTFHVLRMGDIGHYAHIDHGKNSAWESWEENGGDEAGFYWLDDLKYRPKATVVALGLTGQETAADLQRLAEVYEVREAFVGLFRAEEPSDNERLRVVLMALCDGAAEVLYLAGWRRGDSLALAAELLAEVRDAG